MRKLFVVFPILIFLLYIAYPTHSNSNGTGSPGGKTGSIGDGNANTCTNCHYAGTGSGASITTNIPANGYNPGETYTITATIQQSNISKFGFELTAEETTTGNKAGTFLITNSTETQLVNNNNAVTHKAGGTTGINNSKSWSFDWIAPTGTTELITFTGAFLGTNNDFTNSGDTYHSSSLNTQINTQTEIHNIKLETVKFTNNKIITQKKINKLYIYNLSGKKIIIKENLATNEIIDLQKLPKGTYILSIFNQNKKITNRKFSIN